MAYIYLGERDNIYKFTVIGNIDVQINVSKDTFDICSTFEVVKYDIKYSKLPDHDSRHTIWESYILHISTGYSNRFVGHVQNVYSYFPRKSYDIVQRVDSYYNILNDALPFALVFTYCDGKKKFSRYDELVHGNPSELPGSIIEDRKLCENLIRACEPRCRTFRFTPNSGENPNVETREQKICEYNSFKKVMFVPKANVRNPDDFPLCIGNLFTLESEGGVKNEILHALPDKVNGNFDSVRVYYICSDDDSGNIPILIELVEDCAKLHIMRITIDSPRWIEQKFNYGNDEELVDQLNIIKSVIEGATIYELDKDRDGYIYSSRSVIVTEVEQTSNSGYNILRHNFIGENREKTPLLLYNGRRVNPLINMEITDKDKLNATDVDFYDEIRTFALSYNVKEHLLIRITKGNRNYYMYRFTKDGTRWKQLSLQELSKFNVITKDKLRNFELDLPSRGLGEQLDKLLYDSQVNNVKALLDYISFSVNSIVILLDKKSQYGQSVINDIITDEIPPIDINNSIIDPKEYNETSFDCLTSSGFKVYKHHLEQAVSSARAKLDGSKLYLKFYLGSSLIKLYEKDGNKHTPLEHKSDMNDLYVFYYGDSDPRPLLLCYHYNAYRPNSLADYDKKWIRVKKISKCVCEGNDVKDLLGVLYEVVGFLNVVCLKQNTISLSDVDQSSLEEPDSEGKNRSYSIQMFGSNSISIKVTHKNKKCYRVYTYEHNGTDVGDGVSYTLGDIKYDSDDPDRNGLEYKSSKPLSSVSVFYSVHDGRHEYPFLVVLDFKGGLENTDKEYYKLRDKDKKVWVKMGQDHADIDMLKKLENSEKIEEGLYDLREDLKIDFDDKKTPLFKNIECKEDKINVTLVAGTVVGTAAGVATVASVGVLVSKNIAASAAAAVAATTVAL